jgi:hypothetical protein
VVVPVDRGEKLPVLDVSWRLVRERVICKVPVLQELVD